VEVGGFADGVVESDGTCVLTLSQPGRADVSTRGEAVPDARNTSCGALSVGLDQLGPGPVTALLTYRSGRSSGASDPLTIDIP
jgi:hypothetical protein